jgi:DNA-binding NtrC family response regulator
MPPSLNETFETILVVDDNEVVLGFVAQILIAENFRVLTADSGPAALKLAETSTETIDLLLSDVDMPQMSGPDLGEALKKARPAMHVMLMSGGTNGNLLVQLRLGIYSGLCAGIRQPTRNASFLGQAAFASLRG